MRPRLDISSYTYSAQYIYNVCEAMRLTGTVFKSENFLKGVVMLLNVTESDTVHKDFMPS